MPGKDNDKFYDFVQKTQEFRGRIYQAVEDLTEDVKRLLKLIPEVSGLKVQVRIQWWFIAAIILILISTIVKLWVVK